MTRPRPQIEISHSENVPLFSARIHPFNACYSGVLEKPIIYLGGKANPRSLVEALTHEYIHWILHKTICEDACALLDKISLREYT